MTDDQLGSLALFGAPEGIDLVDVWSSQRFATSFVICHWSFHSSLGENDALSTAAPLREDRSLPGLSGGDGAPRAWIEDH
jgi:hypothetical protein